VHGTHQARSRWRSAYVKARNSSSSSSDSKVSAARSSRDRMGLVFLAASSYAAHRRGRITAPAELSAPDVLTEASTGSVCLAAVQHRRPARQAMELLARDWDPPVRSARQCQVVPGWLQPRQNYMGDALGRLRVGSDPRVPPPASPGAPLRSCPAAASRLPALVVEEWLSD
jgi:hypothetical protein